MSRRLRVQGLEGLGTAAGWDPGAGLGRGADPWPGDLGLEHIMSRYA